MNDSENQDNSQNNLFHHQNPSNEIDFRRETFCEMFKNNLCPTFVLKSFTSLIVLLNATIYLITIFYDGVRKGNEFLSPLDSTLLTFGENSPFMIKYHYQIWRLITSLFLSQECFQVISNTFVIIICGSNLEKYTNWKVISSVYFVGGIAGGLFSCLISDKTVIGCSGALFAVCGGIIAKIITLWWNNENLRGRREIFVVTLILFLMICLIIMVFPTPDAVNQIGGMLIGTIFAFSVILNNQNQNSFSRYAKTLGITLTIIYFNVGFFLFYLLREPRFEQDLYNF